MAGFHHIVNRGVARDNIYIGEYPFTLLATVLNDNQEIIPCVEHSQIKREIEYEGIREHLEMGLTDGEVLGVV